MMTTRPDSYLTHLLHELDDIGAAYDIVLSQSAVVNVDPNRGGSSSDLFVGFASWWWAPSDPALEATRMGLLRRLRDWGPLYRLLFPHPVKTVSERLDENLDLLEKWLIREGGDLSVPGNIEEARRLVAQAVQELLSLGELLATDGYPVRMTPDTNTLIDNPDLAAHTTALGPRYVAHVLPVVLGEIDDLKRSGRTAELREAARKADKRLKGLRDNGDVRVGARVAGDVYAVFGHSEPRGEGLPSWLDLTVPDDRFVASSLRLQSEHPGSALYVATSDLNLQNKLAAVGLPFVELP
jgi:rRNA-processing protein FCF1